MDQDAAHAHVAHLAEGDLFGVELRALFRLRLQPDLDQPADGLSARRFVFLFLAPLSMKMAVAYASASITRYKTGCIRFFTLTVAMLGDQPLKAYPAGGAE
jgi:hypothetical protein